MSWNRKYRPQKIADLHLDKVRTQLLRMMEAGKFPQALLFAGPKGTGKTTSSRIIGAIVNDENNLQQIEVAYFDKKSKQQKLKEPSSNSLTKEILAGHSFAVQEMDAASNRGIDDVRQLKTKAQLQPQMGKMAVFILDEAHMLTTEAFNALLKLLEEPPQHAIFILATTELHKIPATVTSRCQVIEFQKATLKEITNTLKKILIEEKIKFEEEALETIAKQADGSFRDAIKLLEMTAQTGKVTLKELSIFSSTSIDNLVVELIDNLLNKDASAVVTLFEQLRKKNIDPKFFHQQLLENLHLSLLQNLNVKKGKPLINQKIAQFLLIELSSDFLSTNSPIPHLPLELKILELIERASGKKNKPINKQPPTRVKKNAKKIINEQETPQQTKPSTFKTKQNSSLTNTRATEIISNLTLNGNGEKLCSNWHALVELVAKENSTIASLLRSAQPITGKIGEATISVFYKFHQEQLSQPKFNALIQEFVKTIADGYLKLNFILNKAPASAELVEVKSESLSQIASQALM